MSKRSKAAELAYKKADLFKMAPYFTNLKTGAGNVNMTTRELMTPLPSVRLEEAETDYVTLKYDLNEMWLRAYGRTFSGPLGMGPGKKTMQEPEPMPLYFDHPYFGRMRERRLKLRTGEKTDDR